MGQPHQTPLAFGDQGMEWLILVEKAIPRLLSDFERKRGRPRPAVELVIGVPELEPLRKVAASHVTYHVPSPRQPSTPAPASPILRNALRDAMSRNASVARNKGAENGTATGTQLFCGNCCELSPDWTRK